MDLLIDGVDLFAKLLQRGRSGRRWRHAKNLTKRGEFEFKIVKRNALMKRDDLILSAVAIIPERSGVFAASRRMELFSLMVRDGARAPPHHEAPLKKIRAGRS